MRSVVVLALAMNADTKAAKISAFTPAIATVSPPALLNLTWSGEVTTKLNEVIARVNAAAKIT